MKMQITFSDLTLKEATALVALQELRQTLELLEPEEKPKRTRRTKAEMAQAKHEVEQDAAQEVASTTSGPPPNPRRRKKRGADVGPAVANLKHGRKKRGGEADPTMASESPTISPSDDEITDEDVMRVASEGAQHLTPKWVVAKLEEFGAAMVNDLSQEQRREFVDAVQAALEKVK